jgi:signal transduction histidine kinase
VCHRPAGQRALLRLRADPRPARRRRHRHRHPARAQVDATTRKGHGIGLSTCRRIIERHCGAIAIGDTPGGGTTIRLTLPDSPCA